MREVPDFIDSDGRLSFVHIAQRRAAENVHWYSVLSMGTQAFLRARRVETEGKPSGPDENALKRVGEKESGDNPGNN